MGQAVLRRLIAAAAISIGLSACHNAPAFQFEAQPSAILQPLSLWDPQLDVSTSGTLYVLAMYEDEGNKARLGFTMSHDGGDTFMLIRAVSPEGAPVTSHGEASPRLANSGTVLYALWRESLNDGSSRLVIARSLSYGHSFEPPVEVTHQKSFVSFASLAALPNGDAFAVWLDGRDEKPNSDTFSIYSAKSTDQGVSFGKAVSVASGSCPCCRPSIAAAPDGKIFIVWRKVFPGDIRDMVVSTSADGGATFSEPVRVSDDGWQIHGCPDSGPSAAFVGGHFFIAWLTEARDEKPRVRMASSTDQGRSFKVQDISGPVLDANHPVLKVTPEGNVVAVFQGRDAAEKASTWARTQAFFVEMTPNGSASVPIPLSSPSQSVSTPTIAAGTGSRLFAAWTQPQSKTETILLSRGRRMR